MRFFKSYLLIVVLTILMVTSSTVYAAFPLKPSQATTNTETVAHKTDVDFNALVNSAVERHTEKTESVPDHSDDWKGADFAMGSFCLGLGALLILVGAIISMSISPGFLVLMILGGMASMILGAVGLDRPKKGFAIAGLFIGTAIISLLLWSMVEVELFPH